MSFIGTFSKKMLRVNPKLMARDQLARPGLMGLTMAFSFSGSTKSRWQKSKTRSIIASFRLMDFNTEELTEHGAPAGLFTMWFGGCKAGSKTVAEALAADDLTTFGSKP